MRARFADGPYDHCVLQVKDGVDHIHLPVEISPSRVQLMEPRVYHCQATYRLISLNDYEGVFQFEGINKP